MKRVSILNVPFTYITKQTLIETLQTHVEKREKAFVVTANPEIVMMASRDDSFMKLVHEATYVTADGIGVVKAAQILGSPLPEQSEEHTSELQSRFDLVCRLLLEKKNTYDNSDRLLHQR